MQAEAAQRGACKSVLTRLPGGLARGGAFGEGHVQAALAGGEVACTSDSVVGWLGASSAMPLPACAIPSASSLAPVGSYAKPGAVTG